MHRTVLAPVILTWVIVSLTAAEGPPTKTAQDLQREAAIAEFTRKMQEANYPALFEKAADEFGVPADVLKGVAFAETRWEHLTWPEGETASPRTGMPRPYGIMSLWDNEFFGHSLIEAAKLIGKVPEELKKDPLQNIRGAAALLKTFYRETPKPAGTTENDIESWRYAIAEYCGIPEPDLKHRHALEVYEFMARGYHQYGIEWPARPVNLGPMREEVRRIVAEEMAKHEALVRQEEERRRQALTAGQTLPPETTTAQTVVRQAEAAAAPNAAPSMIAPGAEVTESPSPAGRAMWIVLLAALVVLLAGRYLVLRSRSKLPKRQ